LIPLIAVLNRNTAPDRGPNEHWSEHFSEGVGRKESKVFAVEPHRDRRDELPSKDVA
jgi:hypothetical protein